ncbi:hypothetical protein [Natrialbaceae archaeon AArc-T1-2]|uniref:hypothetical protein n=1 Tax=Natrialbaceae archaeon AArc-T1-2 TaxID=3053904 RepID=UPI00255A9C3B|nr:hypothetical protein [Natrialbaceae archaeon AArc-T1-2]WIV67436.1 hypothetical protein QQ977_01520 [Natrialbaceae archaeon AArc-T1-2]
MALYDRIADLPLAIETDERTSRRREIPGGSTRVTSTFVLLADDAFGAGEDVTYEAVDHEAMPDPPAFDFAGEYTVEEFSRRLEETDLFPTKPPERDVFRNYRRWALESAALDLALTQNDTDLASVLDRDLSPVRFVASDRVPDGDPTRVTDVLAVNPDCEFKLDPSEDWTEETFATLAATDAVSVLDLKGHYDDLEVGQQPSRELYRAVFETFPDAVVEDPAVDDGVRDLLEANRDRLSWDAPITGVEDVRDRPFSAQWCNIKPSRFGTIRSLFETIEYCERHDVRMYGGGQFELCVGRAHAQLLASIFYPDGPNDVAPRSYNEPDVRTELQTSPLEPPADPLGLEWTRLE